MMTFSSIYFESSIKRMVILCFVLVLLIPISFSITTIFQNSWSKAQQGMLEKHLLISEALVEPFTSYIFSKQKILTVLGYEILSIHKNLKDVNAANITENINNTDNINKENNLKSDVQNIIHKHYKSYEDLAVLSFISSKKEIESFTTYTQDASQSVTPNYSNLEFNLLKTSVTSTDLISSVFTSSFNNIPVIVFKRLLIDEDDIEIGALYAEVSLSRIESMCSRINFGVKGHCATVDHTGKVVSHPNKDWVKESRDLSKISVVKNMLEGESGTIEFYSPFMKADMVAGYSAIPSLGWGVMIPQPKNELTQPFDIIRAHTLIWLLAAILVTLFIAYILMHKIISPISNLIERTKAIDSGYEYVGLGTIPKNSPIEIRQLWNSFSVLVKGLQNSNSEVKKLNASLTSDVSKATKKLRDMNKHLYEISNQDYLTSIANRRHFNTVLKDVLSRSNEESVGIIVIDLDNFKQINDVYGHDIGDLALQHLSDILQKSTRKADLVARFGGDEFVIYVKDLSDRELKDLAEKIRSAVESSCFKANDKSLNFTISVGVINYVKGENKQLKLEELLVNADNAMYRSKQNGRNNMSFACIEKNSLDEKVLIDA